MTTFMEEITTLGLVFGTAIAAAYLHRRLDATWWRAILNAALLFLLQVVLSSYGPWKETLDRYTVELFYSIVLIPVFYYGWLTTDHIQVMRKRHADLQARILEITALTSSFENPIRPWSCLSYNLYHNTASKLRKLGHQVDRKLVDQAREEDRRLFIKLAHQHYATLARKRSQKSFLDEYGVLQDGAWAGDATYFVTHVALPQIRQSNSRTSLKVDELVAILNTLIIPSGASEPAGESPSMISVGSGKDFETYTASLLNAAGWQTELTPKTGDHGADIIATRNQVRVAIQCKFYSSPVGNSSVQEVYSAKDFYGCSAAVVVSNADFTRNARVIATSLNVALVHHDELVAVMERYDLGVSIA